jgi:8-oxo-dGTP pyrophosphatase MutT (NUDIX family)
MKVADFPELITQLQEKLKEPLPSKEALDMIFPNRASTTNPPPDNTKLSAVMLLLYQKNDEWHILAIRRTENGNAHSGQIGFPGGRNEPNDENLLHTALRETYEEIGIKNNDITIVGDLSPVYIAVSNYNVFPYIGFIHSIQNFNISEQEVQEVLEIRLSDLLAPTAKIKTEVISPIEPKQKRIVNAYRLPNDSIIWGATAIMIAELELLIKINNE